MESDKYYDIVSKPFLKARESIDEAKKLVTEQTDKQS